MLKLVPFLTTCLLVAACGGGGDGETASPVPDASADARPPVTDAAPDASLPPDAGSSDPDGAAPDPEDAGTPPADDAAPSPEDAAAPPPDAAVPQVCVVPDGALDPEFLTDLGCQGDFDRLASEPLSTTVPGARSGKVVLDRQGGDALYFQNSVLYPIHYEFASAHLSGGEHPIVGALADFNASEYFSPDRRFLLGAVTYYEGPRRWALELAPYDTASAAMMAQLFHAVQAHAWFGRQLAFHPTSENVAREANNLPDDIPVVTTDELFAEIDYQPLSLATGVGRLRFLQAAALEDTYLSHDDLVVLDEAPNDIALVRGLITETFQTPLSHVNVLSRNRGTPNMGLRGAMDDPTLRALEGRLVELTVGAAEWSIREVTDEEAQAFWEAHRPPPVELPPLDLGPRDLRNIDEVTPEPGPGETLRLKLKAAVQAWGGKAAHYSILRRTEGVPIRNAFAVPVYYYDQFMRENGFYDRIDALLADADFMADPQVRDAALELLRDDMQVAPVDQAFQDLLRVKMTTEYPEQNMRFRTSTNSEDLDGFPCAGCYESHTGDFDDWEDVLDAIRETYASAWLFRTFEERLFYGVDHKSVAMALLVHPNFPDEEANGVAVTSNPFDPSGLDPAFYVNVQFGGDVEVVAPPPGVTSDSFLYYFTQPNQPISYLTHSSLVADGASVLTARQIHDLGVALDALHRRFSEAYGPAAPEGDPDGWYAMDVEFKFDDVDNPGETPALFIKQARPYPKPQ